MRCLTLSVYASEFVAHYGLWVAFGGIHGVVGQAAS
jgi:hypothetical protein